MQGLSADSFTDPEEALAHFKPNVYNAIILDVRMPKMNGFQLAREIWKIDPKANICFLTAFEIFKGEAEKVFPNFGSHCIIKKPILPSELADHIRTHFTKTKYTAYSYCLN